VPKILFVEEPLQHP